MSLFISTAFIVCQSFGYVVPLFSLKSKKSLISFFIFSLTKLPLNRVLLSFHVYVGLLLFFKPSLSFWRCDRMHGIIFNLLVPVEACFVIEHLVKFREGTMRCWEYGMFFCCRMKYSTKSDGHIWFISSVSFDMSLVSFCFYDQSISRSGVLKSPTLIVRCNVWFEL